METEYLEEKQKPTRNVISRANHHSGQINLAGVLLSSNKLCAPLAFEENEHKSLQIKFNL